MLSIFTSDRPCDRKANRPPSRAARAEATRLCGGVSLEPTVDLAVYDEIATGAR